MPQPIIPVRRRGAISAGRSKNPPQQPHPRAKDATIALPQLPTTTVTFLPVVRLTEHTACRDPVEVLAAARYSLLHKQPAHAGRSYQELRSRYDIQTWSLRVLRCSDRNSTDAMLQPGKVQHDHILARQGVPDNATLEAWGSELFNRFVALHPGMVASDRSRPPPPQVWKRFLLWVLSQCQKERCEGESIVGGQSVLALREKLNKEESRGERSKLKKAFLRDSQARVGEARTLLRRKWANTVRDRRERQRMRVELHEMERSERVWLKRQKDRLNSLPVDFLTHQENEADETGKPLPQQDTTRAKKRAKKHTGLRRALDKVLHRPSSAPLSSERGRIPLRPLSPPPKERNCPLGTRSVDCKDCDAAFTIVPEEDICLDCARTIAWSGMGDFGCASCICQCGVER